MCLEPADAVLLAALTRGLVDTAATAWAAGDPAPAVRTELLRVATWRASRSGLAGDLVSPADWRPRPAAEVVDLLRDHVSDALQETGDVGVVDEGIRRLLRTGTGADAQRASYRQTGTLSGVVAHAVERTAAA